MFRHVTHTFICIATALLGVTSAQAQGIWQVQYVQGNGKDTVSCSAFITIAGNGTAQARIRMHRASGIAEWDLQEQYSTDSLQQTDTTRLLYEVTAARAIKGNSAKLQRVFYQFALDSSGNFVPAGIAINRDGPLLRPFTSVLQLPVNELAKNKALVLNYFDTASTFYRNYFGKNSNGGKGSLNLPDAKNTRMFMLVVASTADSTLMPNAAQDARRVIDVFTDLAENEMGISIYVDSIFGKQYNRASVEAALARLKPGKNDIVVFYYSGHGFADQQRKEKEFPFLDLRDPNLRPRPDPRVMAMNIQDIYSTITKKGARLNLVISDCCNDTVEAKKPKSTVAPPATRAPLKYNLNNMAALFFSKTPANYLFTAASKDERAIITPRYSSYFTYFFIESLRSNLSPLKWNPAWNQVFAEAKQQTTLFAGRVPCPNGRNCIQNPRMLLNK